MKSNIRTVPLGWRVFGLGVLLQGAVGLLQGDFVMGQSLPSGVHHRVMLAYAAGALMFAGGVGVQWRRTVAWSAGLLAAYYGIFVVILMNGQVILHHPRLYVAYSGAAEQFAITIGALLLWAATAGIGSATAARITRAGQIAFGVCALLFAGAHFVYITQTAAFVPKWLPPCRVFWAYATGIGFVAAGLALLTSVQARLAAILLTVMLGSFAVLVHLPMLLERSSRTNWIEAAINLSITGAAWVLASTMSRHGR